MSENQKQEVFDFQAEVKQLLHILAYSLYTHKEVFIRELVSNASDALNKINYYQLTNQSEIYGADAELCVRIEFDKSENAIIIKDTGIGMTKNELIENLGTIAKSGTRAFIEKLSQTGKNINDIIGQFGVGFYSAFIVAEKVAVLTKSYIKDEPAYKWVSDGAGKYSIEQINKKDRGTEVVVYLKKDEKEFLEAERVKSVIQKYSNFIRYPIYIENKKVNEIEAIWTKSPSQVKEEEYKEFYKFIAHRYDEPIFKIHKVVDVPLQFSMLLYCPEKNYNFFGLPEKEYGLSLYTNKILIQEQCKDIIPQYFRFMKGIVDSSDIPLNISRETIQNNEIVRKIRSIIVKSIISELQVLLNKDRKKYTEFYKEYNRELKEGAHSDFENRDKLAKLLLFYSSQSNEEQITLSEYVNRKKEGQKEIYYISGADLKTISKSPYLEIFKKKGVEVLYLTEAADEIVLNNLAKFEDMEFKSIDAANLDFVKDLKNADDDTKQEEPELTKDEKKDFEKFLKYLKELLKDKVEDVVESDRLVDSPCCLVNPENAMSSHIQKIMQMMNKDMPAQKKILQVNAKNEMIRNLVKLYSIEKDNELLKNIVFQLYSNAALIDGTLDDLTDTALRSFDIMSEALKLKLKS